MRRQYSALGMRIGRLCAGGSARHQAVGVGERLADLVAEHIQRTARGVAQALQQELLLVEFESVVDHEARDVHHLFHTVVQQQLLRARSICGAGSLQEAQQRARVRAHLTGRMPYPFWCVFAPLRRARRIHYPHHDACTCMLQSNETDHLYMHDSGESARLCG